MLLPLLAALSVPILNVDDEQHVVEMQIGTPPQTVRMLFDTGSNSLWVPSSSCVSLGCRSHKKFNQTASSTFRAENIEFEVDYRSGIILGELAYDTVHIGGLSLSDHLLGVVFKEIGDAFATVPFSGILGFGFGSEDYPSLFDVVVNSGELHDNVAGFYLSPSPEINGELTFGSVNYDHIRGEPIYAAMVSDSFWDIEIEEFFVGEKKTSLCSVLRSRRGKCIAAIDTGTVLLAGPSSFVIEVKAALRINPSCVDVWALPSLSVQIRGKTLTLHPEDYIVFEDGECSLALMEMNVSPPRGPLLVLGSTFLRKFYTILDRDSMQVGFADLPCPQYSPKYHFPKLYQSSLVLLYWSLFTMASLS